MSSITKISPVQSGGYLPQFEIAASYKRWHPLFSEQITDLSLFRFQYNYKPLLVYFYEQDWGDIATGHLRQLHNISGQLHLKGTNLLIITSASRESLTYLSWKEIWSLRTYHDPQNELASILKIYSDDYPSWNTYSGINENIALPALYLLDHSRQVAFAFPNEYLSANLPLREVFAALDNISTLKSDQQSA